MPLFFPPPFPLRYLILFLSSSGSYLRLYNLFFREFLLIDSILSFFPILNLIKNPPCLLPQTPFHHPYKIHYHPPLPRNPIKNHTIKAIPPLPKAVLYLMMSFLHLSFCPLLFISRITYYIYTNLPPGPTFFFFFLLFLYNKVVYLLTLFFSLCIEKRFVIG
ncbi:hypothetical protein BYT27DRAFT_6953066 [Phlegmacium glaucopus]|nr:hypothetical protein BYT27DRAFT_6953066 [Phlegmacium glaucopus]